MPKAMIVTVGMGETVSNGICSAIREQNPDCIVFMVTKESAEQTLPKVLQDRIVKDKTSEKSVLTDEDDVEEIRFESQKIIDNIIKKGYEPKDIVIDYTSGTKAMSAGVVLAALDKKLGSLVYVSGRRDKNGRVISGTERVISLEPNRVYAESFFAEGIKLFNSYQFDACLETLSQAKRLINEPIFQNKVDLLERLAQTYSQWDRFDFSDRSAFSFLKNPSFNEVLAEWGIKHKVERNRDTFFKDKNKVFCDERIADLLENARRRGDIERKYDDAVARLYRCLEYIEQLHIAERKLYKDCPDGKPDTEDLDIEKLPKALQDKYIKCKDTKDNKVKLSLVKGYELLSDLGDNLGKYFMNEYEPENSRIKKLLSLRNNSILGHGFVSIPYETYKEMFNIIEEFLKFLPRINKILEVVRFPKIAI